jgi:hypothetical protein
MKNIGNPYANVIFSCSEEIHQKGKALGLEESFDNYSMLPSLYIHMDSMHRQIQWERSKVQGGCRSLRCGLFNRNANKPPATNKHIP